MAFDATAASVGQEIEKAREALIRTSENAPGQWWTGRELKLAAKNGWSYGAANLALSRLIDDGTFEVKEGKVRLSPPE
jgi:hypothetical protein